MRVTRRSVVPTVLVALVALVLSQGASCGEHPKHSATLSLNAFAHGLAAVQKAEIALYTAGKVPLGQYLPDATPPVCTGHVCVQAKFAAIAELADGVQTALDTWQPGQPVPPGIGPLMLSTKELMHQITALLPLAPEIQQTIQIVYDTITDILIVTAGRGV